MSTNITDVSRRIAWKWGLPAAEVQEQYDKDNRYCTSCRRWVNRLEIAVSTLQCPDCVGNSRSTRTEQHGIRRAAQRARERYEAKRQTQTTP
jgi:predicted RNA-binding Zn-ribbon protein involved in translation (DUF1610 family)